MAFFWCFGSKPQLAENRRLKQNQASSSTANPSRPSETIQDSEDDQPRFFPKDCQVFRLRDLVTATNNFATESLIGRGGFGDVYKGHLQHTGKDVAIKKLDVSGSQGEKEFIVEVLMLSIVQHENLVKLMGYCIDNGERILIYEYMPLGSLEDRLHNVKRGEKGLEWKTRMEIALGAAKGLAHLHDETKPYPVIFRDMKTANILLDHDYKPKLSDFGFAKFGPMPGKTHVSTRVMGTHGYCAPEYAFTGKLTMKSDIYSFGVVMLELITGRKAISDSYTGSNRVLVNWALPYCKNNIEQIVDPKLIGGGILRDLTLKIAVNVAVSCLREDAKARPKIAEVVAALDLIVTRIERKQGKMIMVGSSSSTQGEDFEREKSVYEAKSWALSQRQNLPSPTP